MCLQTFETKFFDYNSQQLVHRWHAARLPVGAVVAVLRAVEVQQRRQHVVSAKRTANRVSVQFVATVAGADGHGVFVAVL